MSDINENINLEDSNYLTKVGGMYKEWFLDYASYVILERAVPDLMDGSMDSFHSGSNRCNVSFKLSVEGS